MEQKFSNYTVHTEIVKDDRGKNFLSIGISNREDEYDGITMHLTPAEAKILSKEIYQAARAMEPQPKKRGKN